MSNEITEIGAMQNPRPTAPGRNFWAKRYKDLFLVDGEPTASNTVWNEFNVSTNPFSQFFPSKGSLLLNLATYTEPILIAQIGSFNITADSIPIYDTWTNAFNNIPAWECAHWIQWFDANRLMYGAVQAKNKMNDSWNYQDNWSYHGAGHYCGYDCDFVNYFRLKGVDVANFGSVTACNLVAIPTDLIDATASVTKTISNTASTLNTLVPIALILGFGLFAINQVKSAEITGIKKNKSKYRKARKKS